MSIVDSLKKRGATGSNIAECIETLPSSGGGSGDSGIFVINLIEDEDSPGDKKLDKTFMEIHQAGIDGKLRVISEVTQKNETTQLSKYYVVFNSEWMHSEYSESGKILAAYASAGEYSDQINFVTFSASDVDSYPYYPA